jgi:hypothetical protein
MRFFQIALLCLCSLLWATESQAQLFRRSYGSGYTTTQNGYYYRGKEYVRGRDLPDNPNCPCPMCRDLVNAYYAARSGQTITRQPVESASTKLVGTPHDQLDKLVEVFQIEKGSNFVLLDPGCGDARILIHAVKKYGCRGVGIEINPETYKIAQAEVKKAGLEDKIALYNGDSRDYSWKQADGVVMFLFPELIQDLTKNFRDLKSGVKVVSWSHDIPMEGTVRCDDIFVWRKDE